MTHTYTFHFALAALGAVGLLSGFDTIALAEETMPLVEEALPEFNANAGRNTGRLPWHLGSWVSLAIILTSLSIAFLLNHARPDTRVIGIGMAALSCFALAAWYLFVVASGILGSPRPVLLPVDVLKPTILSLQGFAALGAGIFLVFIARKQAKRTDTVALENANTQDKYGRVSRYFHWGIAILILVLIPMGIFTSMIPEGTWYRQGYYVAHKTIGLLVLILALGRLAWHIKMGRPKLAATLKTWERRLAKSAHVLLYVFMIGFPLTGYMFSTYGGYYSHFFFWNTPLLWGKNETLFLITATAHKVVLPYLFYLVIGAHVLGALKHQFYDKHRESFARIVG